MSFIIVISILSGIFSGYCLLPQSVLNNCEIIITVALSLLIFSVGIDIGANKGLIKKLKQKGLRLFLIPLFIIIGSLIGGIITGFLFQIPTNISMSIASGLGWYSLSGIMLSKLCNAEIGTIALMTNVFRELLAVITIPLIPKFLNNYTAIAPAGATSMDTTLPLISKATNSEIAVISFCNGFILTALVPILVPFFLNFVP